MIDKRLYSPKYVKEILNRHGFRFSKSLGQNFLTDGNIVRNICQAGEVTKEDCILEIGPGLGTLTEELALNAKKVVAVELDESLLPVLEETLKRYNNIEVVHGDILKVDVNRLIDEKLGGGPIKVIANLPYYVTTPIIAKLIEEDLNIETITVMVQKEVAERIVASPGNKQYGSLSVFINFYTSPEIVMEVPRTVFMPQPNVNSAVVKLKLKKELPEVDKKLFFKVVRSAFGKRRKTILNSLSSGELDLEKEDIKKVLERANISSKKRAEDLKIEDFVKISKILPPLDI
ncbi:MAG: 16S rRNA (adenine(1518)-N(6)/adenine(1519)-N(6))-dimethyltransferase RsmA [Tissierellia bacterium]|nr:16S rRNA (adenine(1518)-N(6)/adenine(1519)-N(6))-dimethyltransferase RsmA [Tissierellia bacterium]